MSALRPAGLALAFTLTAHAWLCAQAPDFAGLESRDERRPAAKITAVPPSSEKGYDFLLSASDKTFNQLIGAVLKMGEGKPSKSGKKLQALSVSFPKDGYMALAGSYTQPQTAQTKEGTFKFNVVARLGAPAVNVVQLDIVGASVYLNGARIFNSDSADTAPIGVMLDFLSPGISQAAGRSLHEAETAIARRYGQGAASPGTRVEDLLVISGNKVLVKILPGLLSPLFPPIQVTQVKIASGKIDMKANFQ
ncbi:MAG: hypothetical protein HY816_03130 [Candidatus Wallbacteria bacterium]|nr:hypothetical protein [Candidatus Wallbacteria bacterium]